jgi:hypothetical protein
VTLAQHERDDATRARHAAQVGRLRRLTLAHVLTSEVRTGSPTW